MSVNKIGSSKNFYIETNEPTSLTVPAGAYLPGANYETTIIDASENIYTIDPNNISPIYIKDTLQSINSIGFTAPDAFAVGSNLEKSTNRRGVSFFKTQTSDEFVFLDDDYSVQSSTGTSDWTAIQDSEYPEIVFSTSGQVTNDTVAPTLTGVLENDVILVITSGDDALVNNPTGYTQIVASSAAIAGGVFYRMSYKVAGAVPDTSVTISAPTTEGAQSVYVIYVIRNVKLSAGVPSYTLSSILTGTAVPSIAGITNSYYSPGLGIFTTALDDDNATGELPGYDNFIRQSASSTGQTLFTGSKFLAYSESITSQAITTSGSDDWIAYSIVFEGPGSGFSALCSNGNNIYASKFGSSNFGKVFYGQNVSSLADSYTLSVNKIPLSVIGSVSAVGTTSISLSWASLSPQIGDIVIVSVGSDGGSVSSPGGWTALDNLTQGTEFTGTFALNLASVITSATFTGSTSMVGVAILLRPLVSGIFNIATDIQVTSAGVATGNGVELSATFAEADVAIRVTHVDDDITATGATITGTTGYSAPLFYNASAAGQSLSVAWKTFTSAQSETATLSITGVNDEVVSKLIKISGINFDMSTVGISSMTYANNNLFLLTQNGLLLRTADVSSTPLSSILNANQAIPKSYSKTYANKAMFWFANKAIVVNENGATYLSTFSQNVISLSYFAGYFYAILDNGVLQRSVTGQTWSRIYRSPAPEVVYHTSNVGTAGSATISFSGQAIKNGDLIIVSVVTDGDEAAVPDISINDDGVGWIQLFHSAATSAAFPNAKIYYVIANENNLPGQVVATGVTGVIAEGYVIRGARTESAIKIATTTTTTPSVSVPSVAVTVSQNYRNHILLSYVFVDDNALPSSTDFVSSVNGISNSPQNSPIHTSTTSVTGGSLHSRLYVMDSEYSVALATPSYTLSASSATIAAAVSIPAFASKVNDLVNLSGSRLVAVSDGGAIGSTDNIVEGWYFAEGVDLSIDLLDDIKNVVIDGTRIVGMGNTGYVYYNDEQLLRLLLVGQGPTKEL